MARDPRELLDFGDPRGGNLAPIRQRRLRQAKPGGKPDKETALRPQQEHAIDGDVISAHKQTIGQSDISSQEANSRASDEGLLQTRRMEIGQLIRHARMRLGLTQAEAAKKLEVQQSAISQWELGRVEPEAKNRLKLSAVLNIPLEEIMPSGSIADPEPAPDSAEVQQLIRNYLALPRSVRTAVQLHLLGLVEALRSR